MQRITELDEYDNDFANYLYDIQHRKKQYKIKDNYWDTMKAIEKTTTRLLTPQQLQLVNQQINIEFNPAELQALLAEINERDQKEN